MAQRTHVSASGNWENEGNVPCTVFFDKTRNPNDPEEYLNIPSEEPLPKEAPPSKLKDHVVEPAIAKQGAVKPAHERSQSIEDDGSGFSQYTNSPGHCENPGRRAAPTGPEHCIDRSPLHHHAKASGRDSPSWEGRSFESGDGNPGKTRMRPLALDDAPEGTAVPKFGSWDVNNPASADGFTHIFNQVREQRLGSSSPYNNLKMHQSDDNAKWEESEEEQETDDEREDDDKHGFTSHGFIFKTINTEPSNPKAGPHPQSQRNNKKSYFKKRNILMKLKNLLPKSSKLSKISEQKINRS